MNDTLTYIETPRTTHRIVRIDAILEQRMREFMLTRRQKLWYTGGNYG